MAKDAIIENPAMYIRRLGLASQSSQSSAHIRTSLYLSFAFVGEFI